MINVLAIIPARGGSKGIHRKNIKKLGGRPLIYWSLAQAIAELGKENVLVSTEDQEIFDTAKAHDHYYPYVRPPGLASDETPTEPVIAHALDWYTENVKLPEYVMLLQPTSPVRKPGRLTQACDMLISRKLDSLVSVTASHAFFWTNRYEHATPMYDLSKRPRRQDFNVQNTPYRENGSIYLSTYDSFKRTGNRVSGKIGLLEMEDFESIEIDTPLDWKINEAIFENLKWD